MCKMGKIFNNWVGTNGLKVKIKNVKFTVVGSGCRENLKVGNFTVLFCRQRQRNVLKCIFPHSTNHINQWLVALALPPSFLKLPIFRLLWSSILASKVGLFYVYTDHCPKLRISLGNLPTMPSPCFCLNLPAWSKCLLNRTSQAVKKLLCSWAHFTGKEISSLVKSEATQVASVFSVNCMNKSSYWHTSRKVKCDGLTFYILWYIFYTSFLEQEIVMGKTNFSKGYCSFHPLEKESQIPDKLLQTALPGQSDACWRQWQSND